MLNILRTHPMQPKAKRPAESDWAQGDRIRAAFVRATIALSQLSAAIADAPDGNQPQIPAETVELFNKHAGALVAHTQPIVQPSELPRLPTECWGIIMEFVLERRTTAKFGVEPREWWPVASHVLTNRLRCLRLVSRTWHRLASDLVQAIRVPPHVLRQYQPADIVELFPHARFMQHVASSKRDKKAICEVVQQLDAIATHRLGPPPPPETSRIWHTHAEEQKKCYYFSRFHGRCDTVYSIATPSSMLEHMTTSDVMSVHLSPELPAPKIIQVPAVLRAKTIVVFYYDKSGFKHMLAIFRAIGAAACAKLRVFAHKSFRVGRFRLSNLGVRCRPDNSDDPETVRIINNWTEDIREIFSANS